MIETHFHPLDEIQAFAHTWHGLAEGGPISPTVMVGGVRWPLPFEAPHVGFGLNIDAGADTHLLQVPDIGPVPLSPEELAAEAAQGRVWQNYALLSGGELQLFGRKLGGWVCIDPAGARWLVRPSGFNSLHGGQVVPGEVANFQLRVVPFGYLDEPAATPVELEVALADVGQAGIPGWTPAGDSLFPLGLNSISSDGRRVVVHIRNQFNFEGTRELFPVGYLLLTLSGTGPHFTLSMEVLRTRAQCFPVFVSEGTACPTKWVKFVTEDQEVEQPPGSGFTETKTKHTGVTYEEPVAPTDFYNRPVGSGTHTHRYEGRVATVVFDDTDTLRTFTVDLESTCTYSLPSYSFESSGYIWSNIHSYTPHDLDTKLNRTYSGSSAVNWILRLDGVEMERVTYSLEQSGNELIHLYYVPGPGGGEFVEAQQTRTASFGTDQRLELRGLAPLEGSVASGEPGSGMFGTYPQRQARFGPGSGEEPDLFRCRYTLTVHPSLGWPSVGLRALRHSNQIAAVEVALFDQPAGLGEVYTARLVAAGATWEGDGVPDAFRRESTYEPKQQLIATTANEELRSPCWI
ncbi:hypothetical protein D9M70_321000 [compost metagenome]